MNTDEPLSILLLAAEVVPFAKTGGLADTVKDFNPTTGEGNGFAFEPYDAMALYTALVRATEHYKHKGEWHKLMMFVRCLALSRSR